MTAPQWLETIISYSLQVLVVIGFCHVVERVVAQTADRCAVWSMGFFSVLALGCAAVFLPRLHLFQPWSQFEPNTLITVSAAETIIGQFLFAVWCIGATVSLVRWIAQGFVLRRVLQRSELMPSAEVRRLMGLTKIDYDDTNIPTVLISDETDGPFCWQLHTPKILLPRFILAGSRDDLRFVLLHELEHLKTNHPLQLFWQRLAQVICWFHPAVWKGGTRASLVREFSCDEAAAGSGAEIAAYLRTLLHIAERSEKQKTTSAICFGRSPSEIVVRAHRLVYLAKKNANSDAYCGKIGRKSATLVFASLTCLLALITIPSDPLASSRSAWSPWPTWTARSLHCFGCNLRDYEQYDRRVQVFEILHDNNSFSVAAQPTMQRP